jgi:thioredoxin reductase (NADPH)
MSQIEIDPMNNSSKQDHLVEKVIILGSGPAGLTAAIYTARADLSPLLLTGMELHGQVAVTDKVENYPGFPDGIGGAELGDLFQRQAEGFGARIEFDTVTEVNLNARPFQVKTYDKTFTGESIIISTGATPNRLKVPGETELIGKGVSYCATCDGWFFKGKNVVVVGGGDSSLEEGLFLTRFASSVTIIHRRDSFRAGAILQDRARKNPKIKFVLNSVVTEIIGNDKVEEIVLKNVVSGEIFRVETEGVFIFIGHSPNTELFTKQVEIDSKGYILVNQLMETNIPGVYAAGEVADPNNRQVVTSAGMGAVAGIQAGRYLERILSTE